MNVPDGNSNLTTYGIKLVGGVGKIKRAHPDAMVLYHDLIDPPGELGNNNGAHPRGSSEKAAATPRTRIPNASADCQSESAIERCSL